MVTLARTDNFPAHASITRLSGLVGSIRSREPGLTGAPTAARCGALGRIRTCDLPFRRGLLYPLSYEGARSGYPMETTFPAPRSRDPPEPKRTAHTSVGGSSVTVSASAPLGRRPLEAAMCWYPGHGSNTVSVCNCMPSGTIPATVYAAPCDASRRRATRAACRCLMPDGRVGSNPVSCAILLSR